MFKKADWPQFLKEVEKCEYIICIGAGKRLQRMKETFNENGIMSKVRYIADNDCSKQGAEITINERKIQVQSVASLTSVTKSNVMIIITCLFYADILEQLETQEAFQQNDIYSLTHILGDYSDDRAMKRKIPDNLRLSGQMLIPKTIHYCWFGRNPIPDQYKIWMDSWKKYCPDYEIVEWNEDNYDMTKNQYMLQAYEQRKWGFVPDYARLDIIYNHGGVYLDTDVELINNIDDLLYQRGFAGFESDKYVALGLGFGAAAGNQLIKGMMDAYDNYSFLDKEGNMNLTPSPVIQTDYLLGHGLKQDGEYQILENELTIYPEKMLSGKSITSKRIKLTPYTRGIHHYDGSWLDAEKKNMMKQIEKEMNTK
ncbi:polysaccharide biosynthesis protein CpsM(V) [Lachnospiraceae bacterium KM106-2]|nr:polysaccharide biosynthesis protein CpsM(V) [Lachnospiraceae bacterium KM106-2]